MAEYIFKPENNSSSLTSGIEDMCALLPNDWYGTIHEEIVRCRDCIYFDKYENDEISVCYRFDNEQPIVEPNGFCAWGEKKGSL